MPDRRARACAEGGRRGFLPAPSRPCGGDAGTVPAAERGSIVPTLPPYVSDVDYTSRFFPETAPARVAFAMAAAGQDPGRALAPRRVLELGFGQGFGLALLAAANPDCRFEGCDFNARHVANARALAGAAGLANLAVEAASFAEAAARGGPRDVDFAIVHGVLAWVDPPARDAVAAILRQRLVDGGVALVSYNCSPGWAARDPLRQVARAVARTEADPRRRTAAFLDQLDRLSRAGAAYVAVNPGVPQHIAAMAQADPAYLAHEYFGAAARALAVDEVQDLLAPCGLGYAASATIVENIDGLALPAGVAALVAEADDPAMRETLRDLGANKSFRRDLFRRGPSRPGAADRALDAMSFALQVPVEEATFTFDAPFGPVTGHPHVYGPLVGRLLHGPAGFAELAALPAFAAAGRGALVEALSLMVDANRVAPLVCPAADPAPALRFNRAVVDRAGDGPPLGHLASPVTRSGVAVEDLEMLMLRAGISASAPLGAEAASTILAALRLPASAASPYRAMTSAELSEARSNFIRCVLPVFGSLDILTQD